MTTTNFKTETKQALIDAGKDPSDITFIGSEDAKYRCTWQEFLFLSGFTYDSGFGGSYIATDLVIVFADGSWLERGEYDGSEWWEYKRVPQPPIAATNTITTLTSRWGGLDSAHRAGN